MLRQPIVCVLGHVDHGKTTLLDGIRETAVAAREAGGITQHVSASEIPISAIRDHCGNLLARMKINLTLPGLLFIDTPGHEAFVNLRRRGGSIADIAILVVDLNQGVQPQTKEAIEILREYKTPFVIAASKIDALSGWRPVRNACFSDTFGGQRQDVRDQLDTKLYQLVGQLSEMGFSTERFDRIEDVTKQIAIIPVSARTMEGIPELLLFVGGLAQRFLESQLESREGALGKGNILEVKEERGLGKTLNVILYEGVFHPGDEIMFLNVNAKVTRCRIKALLEPEGNDRYAETEEAVAAKGVKICCECAGDAVAGSSLFVINDSTATETEQLLLKEVTEIEVESEQTGVIVKADALGSLEGIVKLFEAEKIPMRRASIGKVVKKDVLEAASVAKQDKFAGVIFAFHTGLEDGVLEAAGTEHVKIFEEKIIYNLIINYKGWKEELIAKERRDSFTDLTLPAKIYLMPGNCFRVNNPAIFGVEILEGRIRKENLLMDDKGEKIGEIRSIQVEKEEVEEAKKGQEVALAVGGITYGRQVREKQVLYTDISPEEIETIEKKYIQSLSDGEKELLLEIKKIKGILSFGF